MTKRFLRAVPLLLTVPAIVAVPVLPAVSDDGDPPTGDAVIERHTFSIPKGAGVPQRTATVMCPEDRRAVGGGVVPDSPLGDGTVDNYRIFYSAPVDSSGLASSTGSGDVPRGWQVVVTSYTILEESEAFTAFAVCSATTDAVIVSEQPPSPQGVLEVVVECPDGAQALAGGVGQTNVTPIPADTMGPLLYETGPVDETGAVDDTLTGDRPVGWRTVSDASPHGNRFFAVCSTSSDAEVATSSVTAPGVGHAAVPTGVTCPEGRRATSGGLTYASQHDPHDRVALTGPGSSLQASRELATGDPADGWYAVGRGSSEGERTMRAFAVCVESVAPPDTTPPQTVKKGGPEGRTTKRTSTFRFISEPGATFRCRLDDGRAKRCTSPYTLQRLAFGKHVVRVAARDEAGNLDPTPATWRFRVVRR